MNTWKCHGSAQSDQVVASQALRMSHYCKYFQHSILLRVMVETAWVVVKEFSVVEANHPHLTSMGRTLKFLTKLQKCIHVQMKTEVHVLSVI